MNEIIKKGKPIERKSIVKDLISLRPISPVIITETHPLEILYDDTNPPPKPVDQFAPYLSRLLTMKRHEKIEKLRGSKSKEPPTFILTSGTSRTPSSQTSHTHRKTNSVSDQLPPVVDPIERPKTTNQSVNQRIKMEQAFDKIASGSSSVALHRLIESTLQVYFLAESVFYFHDVSSVKVLYCPSTTGHCPHGSGLVGYSQFTRQVINCESASSHVAYSPLFEANLCHPDSRVLVFPLFDSNTNVKGVVFVVRNQASPVFNEHDEEFVEYLQMKCQMYSRWLFQAAVEDSFISNLIQNCRLKQFIEVTYEKLTRLFSCRFAEIWYINKQTNSIKKHTPVDHDPIDISLSEAGIAGYSLRQQIPVSCISARVHSAYSSKSDGNGDLSFLSIPIRDPDSPIVYAIVLRGKRLPQFFTDNDEKILAKVAPYVIASLNSAMASEKNFRALEDSMKQQYRLRSLLEVAEILASELHLSILIPKIMSRACELVKADRCSLFMVNETRDKLITTFTGGLKDAIEIPINAGIVGHTAVEKEILNIPDAYQDIRFNKATDLKTGYRTLTLLTVPIYDYGGNVIGVTEMINKIDGVFSEEDVKLIQTFNVFCGISLENARLYRASIDLSVQLKTFMEISVSLTQQHQIKKLLEEIIKNTRKVIGAVTAALFMIEDCGISFTPMVMDEDLEARIELKDREKKVEDSENSLGVKRALILKLMQGKKLGKEDGFVDEEYRNKLISHVISVKESILENDTEHHERSLMIAPILGTDRVVLGAVMMQWKKNQTKFSLDDLKLLESYSVFLSISLERSKLKSIAALGTMEVELQTWISSNERTEFVIPTKLQLNENDQRIVLSKDFNAEQYKGIGLIKTVYCVFNRFDLLNKFKISSETMYRFLYQIRASYNDVPYHNWNHSVDVTQFMAYMIIETGLEYVLTPFEIMALLVSAICHDANHDGFTNQYNVKAQTPLGILFRNQSVMETHHCSVSIGILTKDGSNIFSSLSETDIQKIWQLFISLILATDMAQHFLYVDAAKLLVHRKNEWTAHEPDRLLVMQLLIKIADVSNVARKFEIADKWCDVLCEEFFRQGDLERAAGMEYSSPMNDREHLDKAKSQIGFYSHVCLPLFQVFGSICDMFSPVLKQAVNNLTEWQRKNLEFEEEMKRKDEIEKIQQEEKGETVQ